jgi:prolipoprotein diacylglyceryl transferase
MSPVLAEIPSPSSGVWHLGPVPIRAYALCIAAGIIVAVVMTQRRWKSSGYDPEDVLRVVTWAVPFGIVGARVYHLITDPELYFTRGKHPLQALEIWHGGLGIWGAVAGGAVGAWIGCRRAGIRLSTFAGAVAPGLAVAQALGRWGNYFNQELFGGPSSLPWAVRIDPQNRPAGTPDVATYQPTFLYEALWDLGVAALVIWAERRFRLGPAKAFALYVAAYTAGRGWVEALRVDHANHFLGLRLNDWTSLLIFLAAMGFLLFRRSSPADSQAPGSSGLTPGGRPTLGDAAEVSTAKGPTFSTLLIILTAMAGGALGAATIGGAFGTLVVIALLLSVIGLLVRWSGAPR